MRSLAFILAPFTLAGIAYVAAQSLAVHDWLTAAPLVVLLFAGLALLAPGHETSKPSSGAVAPCFAPAQPATASEADGRNGATL